MLDPTISAAIVQAGGSILVQVLKLAMSTPPSGQATKVINKTYEKLAPEVTTNTLRVLIALRQVGSAQFPAQVRPLVESMRQRQEPNGKRFEADLTYRLKFLCLLGLLQPVGGLEYALTDLGGAFVDKARTDQARYSLAFLQ
jgi:hypothetical protein